MTDAVAQRIAAAGLVCVCALSIVGMVVVTTWGRDGVTTVSLLSVATGTCLGALANFLTANKAPQESVRAPEPGGQLRPPAA